MEKSEFRDRAPILSALMKYSEENNLRLHMPGHLGGRGMTDLFREMARLDVTEVPGIDDLHRSETSIEAARILLARAYGASESFFLVNGATSGLHALLLSLPDPNGVVLLSRNSHRALWGGMVLSGVFPVYIPCCYDEEVGIPVAVRAVDVKEKLILNPKAMAVFITSPTYYGTSSRIKNICQETSQNGTMLLVDEAHGGHFAFHPDFPRPAIHQGADAVVNGLHKTLPVLNPGACLHIGPKFRYRDKLAAACSLLSTTSPSFPLLASIDRAREFMMEHGHEYLEAARKRAFFYRARINKLRGFQVFDAKQNGKQSVDNQDLLKLVIQIKGLDVDGYQVATILRVQYRIQVELHEPRLVLAMMSMFHSDDEWEKLFQALKDIDQRYWRASSKQVELSIPPMPKVVLSPRQSFASRKRVIKLKDSIGHVSGEMIAPYPPGVPCLLPGELIDAETLDYLCYIKRSDFTIHGSYDPGLNNIVVLDAMSGGR